MKVGTDAMLLGAWAQPPPDAAAVLDVGTGTGVLALMMAQKTDPNLDPGSAHGLRHHQPQQQLLGQQRGTPGEQQQRSTAGSAQAVAAGAVAGRRAALVLAIDVDEGACNQATENAAASRWAPRVRVEQVTLQQLDAAATAAATASAAPSGCTGSAAAVAHDKGPGGAAPQQEREGKGEGEARWGGGRACSAAAVAAAAAQSEAAAAPLALPRCCLGPFDAIISNPPFFVASSKPHPGRDARASARHADVALPFQDLARCCSRLLAPHGGLFVVLPCSEALRFVEEASTAGLRLVERVHVFTVASDTQPKRHLMKFVHCQAADCGREQPHQEDQQAKAAAQAEPLPPLEWDLAINEPWPAEGPWPSGSSRRFTAAYRRLTRDFHHPDFLGQQ